MPEWRETHPGVEEMKVAVMGCVVNGPGESKHADIGISLPGTFEAPVAPVFVDGKLDRTLRGDHIVDEFIDLLEDYVDRRYGAAAWSAAVERPAKGVASGAALHDGRLAERGRPRARVYTFGNNAGPPRNVGDQPTFLCVGDPAAIEQQSRRHHDES